MLQQLTYFLKINDLTVGGKLILLREKVTLSQPPCAELKCLFSIKRNYLLMLLVTLTYDLMYCLKHSKIHNRIRCQKYNSDIVISICTVLLHHLLSTVNFPFSSFLLTWQV